METMIQRTYWIHVTARKQNARSVLEIEGVAMQTLKKLVIPFKMFDTSS